MTKNINNINDENELDSLQNSAANASDAPPGEKELGNLLDKKIRLMERTVFKSRSGNERIPSHHPMKGLRMGKMRGTLRPKSAMGAIGGGMKSMRRTSTAAFESSVGRGTIRPPPKSRLRPKSAAIRRLPY